MFKKFIKDEGGNFGIIFGLTLLPIVGLMGAGFDYSSMSNTKGRIQSAADVAILAAAKDAGSFSEFQTLSDQYLSANLPDIDLNLETRPSAKSVGVAINSQYETTFMALVGVPTIDIKVDLEVAVDKFSNGKVKISNSAKHEMTKTLDETERKLLQAVGNLPPRDQEKTRKRIKQRIAMMKKQIANGDQPSSPIYLIK